MHNQENCCNKLFADFKFQNILDADPPETKGVYVIRIKKKGETSIEKMIRKTKKLISSIGWKMVEEFVIGRVKRLSRIGECPIIYIGSAAPKRKQKYFKRKIQRAFKPPYNHVPHMDSTLPRMRT